MLNQPGRQNVQVQNRINDAKALLEKVKNQGLNSSLDSSFDSDISGFPDKPDTSFPISPSKLDEICFIQKSRSTQEQEDDNSSIGNMSYSRSIGDLAHLESSHLNISSDISMDDERSISDDFNQSRMLKSHEKPPLGNKNFSISPIRSIASHFSRVTGGILKSMQVPEKKHHAKNKDEMETVLEVKDRGAEVDDLVEKRLNTDKTPSICNVNSTDGSNSNSKTSDDTAFINTVIREGEDIFKEVEDFVESMNSSRLHASQTSNLHLDDDDSILSWNIGKEKDGASTSSGSRHDSTANLLSSARSLLETYSAKSQSSMKSDESPRSKASFDDEQELENSVKIEYSASDASHDEKMNFYKSIAKDEGHLRSSTTMKTTDLWVSQSTMSIDTNLEVKKIDTDTSEINALDDTIDNDKEQQSHQMKSEVVGNSQSKAVLSAASFEGVETTFVSKSPTNSIGSGPSQIVMSSSSISSKSEDLQNETLTETEKVTSIPNIETLDPKTTSSEDVSEGSFSILSRKRRFVTVSTSQNDAEELPQEDSTNSNKSYDTNKSEKSDERQDSKQNEDQNRNEDQNQNTSDEEKSIDQDASQGEDSNDGDNSTREGNSLGHIQSSSTSPRSSNEDELSEKSLQEGKVEDELSEKSLQQAISITSSRSSEEEKETLDEAEVGDELSEKSLQQAISITSSRSSEEEKETLDEAEVEDELSVKSAVETSLVTSSKSSCESEVPKKSVQEEIGVDKSSVKSVQALSISEDSNAEHIHSVIQESSSDVGSDSRGSSAGSIASDNNSNSTEESLSPEKIRQIMAETFGNQIISETKFVEDASCKSNDSESQSSESSDDLIVDDNTEAHDNTEDTGKSADVVTLNEDGTYYAPQTLQLVSSILCTRGPSSYSSTDDAPIDPISKINEKSVSSRSQSEVTKADEKNKSPDSNSDNSEQFLSDNKIDEDDAPGVLVGSSNDSVIEGKEDTDTDSMNNIDEAPEQLQDNDTTLASRIEEKLSSDFPSINSQEDDCDASESVESDITDDKLVLPRADSADMELESVLEEALEEIELEAELEAALDEALEEEESILYAEGESHVLETIVEGQDETSDADKISHDCEDANHIQSTTLENLSQISSKQDSDDKSQVSMLKEENLRLQEENMSLQDELNSFDDKLACLEMTLGIIETVEKSDSELRSQSNDGRDDCSTLSGDSRLSHNSARSIRSNKSKHGDIPKKSSNESVDSVSSSKGSGSSRSTKSKKSAPIRNTFSRLSMRSKKKKLREESRDDTSNVTKPRDENEQPSSNNLLSSSEMEELAILRENNSKMLYAIKALARATTIQTRKHYHYKRRLGNTQRDLEEENVKLNQVQGEMNEFQTNFYNTRAALLEEKDKREELSFSVQSLAKKMNEYRRKVEEEEEIKRMALERIDENSVAGTSISSAISNTGDSLDDILSPKSQSVVEIVSPEESSKTSQLSLELEVMKLKAKLERRDARINQMKTKFGIIRNHLQVIKENREENDKETSSKSSSSSISVQSKKDTKPRLSKIEILRKRRARAAAAAANQ
ncbi:predicted protein [Chaetoceros tenuissimus]|uniref:Uncharacterized protein n=1 Tax=Chaetoceros tenuissimus TaxID=426638 RepID=A0AAD3DB96_9STRA|nr:predicted protein [Chaetoceros tenuissimus]